MPNPFDMPFIMITYQSWTRISQRWWCLGILKKTKTTEEQCKKRKLEQVMEVMVNYVPIIAPRNDDTTVLCITEMEDRYTLGRKGLDALNSVRMRVMA